MIKGLNESQYLQSYDGLVQKRGPSGRAGWAGVGVGDGSGQKAFPMGWVWLIPPLGLSFPPPIPISCTIIG
jgi:hypothetical protein